jgi:hypothetical protein
VAVIGHGRNGSQQGAGGDHGGRECELMHVRSPSVWASRVLYAIARLHNFTIKQVSLFKMHGNRNFMKIKKFLRRPDEDS